VHSAVQLNCLQGFAVGHSGSLQNGGLRGQALQLGIDELQAAQLRLGFV